MTARSSSMFPNPPRAPQHAHLLQIDCRPIQIRRGGKHSCSWRSRSIYLASLFLLMERVRVASFPILSLSLEFTPVEFKGFDSRETHSLLEPRTESWNFLKVPCFHSLTNARHLLFFQELENISQSVGKSRISFSGDSPK